MNRGSRRCVVVALVAAFQLLGAAGAGAADIYLVYSGVDKLRLAAVVAQVPAEWGAVPYNADLLAFADDDGRRNVAEKLQRADLVIFVDEKASRRFPPSLVAAQSSVVLSEDGYQSEIADLASRIGAP